LHSEPLFLIVCACIELAWQHGHMLLRAEAVRGSPKARAGPVRLWLVTKIGALHCALASGWWITYWAEMFIPVASAVPCLTDHGTTCPDGG
jgi:hypothetical protein